MLPLKTIPEVKKWKHDVLKRNATKMAAPLRKKARTISDTEVKVSRVLDRTAVMPLHNAQLFLLQVPFKCHTLFQ
jgi:hypothetical protein